MAGGLYKNVKMSLKSANIITLVLIASLIVAFVVVISNNGFIVSFDANGGTAREPIKVMYGEKIEIENPSLEGKTFKGWYMDKNCTVKWDENAIIENSMTLYAGWE